MIGLKYGLTELPIVNVTWHGHFATNPDTSRRHKIEGSFDQSGRFHLPSVMPEFDYKRPATGLNTNRRCAHKADIQGPDLIGKDQS